MNVYTAARHERDTERLQHHPLEGKCHGIGGVRMRPDIWLDIRIFEEYGNKGGVFVATGIDFQTFRKIGGVAQKEAQRKFPPEEGTVSGDDVGYRGWGRYEGIEMLHYCSMERFSALHIIQPARRSPAGQGEDVHMVGKHPPNLGVNAVGSRKDRELAYRQRMKRTVARGVTSRPRQHHGIRKALGARPYV